MTVLQASGSKDSSGKEAAIAHIREAGRRWPSTFISRTQVPQFTGGLYSAGSMANKDCRGEGVRGAFRIGRQVCYPIENLVEWLVERLEV